MTAEEFIKSLPRDGWEFRPGLTKSTARGSIRKPSYDGQLKCPFRLVAMENEMNFDVAIRLGINESDFFSIIDAADGNIEEERARELRKLMVNHFNLEGD